MSKLEPFTSGYMKPPKHSQFKKGKSGNPKGRPRKPDDVPMMIKRVLKRKVRVAGEGKKITLMEGLIYKLRERVMEGDTKAFAISRRILETDLLLNPVRGETQDILYAVKLRLAEIMGLVVGADGVARDPEDAEEYERNAEE